MYLLCCAASMKYKQKVAGRPEGKLLLQLLFIDIDTHDTRLLLSTFFIAPQEKPGPKLAAHVDASFSLPPRASASAPPPPSCALLHACASPLPPPAVSSALHLHVCAS
ncbi:hypothetical protein GOP47_0029699, partial [Adiantum capillus-veneris]